ncbi:unnamed protein product [Moneuplotes crassus]|uniref:Uncharacterized protein n=1 Tax=Euplotes crassus TaxID=5936 RepID=A0AAD1Y6R0_EUPCR|nr:unnamed protein product [Moneuplotes crassus]
MSLNNSYFYSQVNAKSNKRYNVSKKLVHLTSYPSSRIVCNLKNSSNSSLSIALNSAKPSSGLTSPSHHTKNPVKKLKMNLLKSIIKEYQSNQYHQSLSKSSSKVSLNNSKSELRRPFSLQTSPQMNENFKSSHKKKIKLLISGLKKLKQTNQKLSEYNDRFPISNLCASRNASRSCRPPTPKEDAKAVKSTENLMDCAIKFIRILDRFNQAGEQKLDCKKVKIEILSICEKATEIEKYRISNLKQERLLKETGRMNGNKSLNAYASFDTIRLNNIMKKDVRRKYKDKLKNLSRNSSCINIQTKNMSAEPQSIFDQRNCILPKTINRSFKDQSRFSKRLYQTKKDKNGSDKYLPTKEFDSVL